MKMKKNQARRALPAPGKGLAPSALPGFVPGFTLLEVMIAVTLLGVGLVAVLGLSTSSVRMAEAARELRKDAELAAELDAAEELPAGALRQEAEKEALSQFPGRAFRVETGSGPHPSVAERRILIFRDQDSREPDYRLIRFVEAASP